MKKGLLISALATSIILSCAVVNAADDEVKVYLDGTQLQFEQPPVIQNGTTLVPMRALFEALGAEVDWDGETQHAMGIAPGILVELDIGSTTMRRNTIDTVIDVPAQIINDRTMIPLRVVSESFGMQVDWDANASSIYLTDKDIIHRLHWNDSYYYIGETQNGKASGYGALYSYETDMFDEIGIFNETTILQGTRFLDNGDIYTGHFMNGAFNGQGIYFWGAGDMYVGDFKDGDSNGQGSYYCSNGDIYVGNFNNGELNGQATFYFAGGAMYVGDCVNGKRSGQGIYYYSDGYYEVGNWVDNEPDGLIACYAPDGTFIKYEMYSNGVLIN